MLGDASEKGRIEGSIDLNRTLKRFDKRLNEDLHNPKQIL